MPDPLGRSALGWAASSSTHQAARNIEAIAYHGWGFGAECWQADGGWVERFARLGVTLCCADRGYFGAAQSPEFLRPDSFKVLLTHSYGLHWCPEAQRRSAHLLICLGGFRAFHPALGPTTGLEHRRSQRRVSRMIQAFGTEPGAVLTEFWRNCYGLDGPELSDTAPPAIADRLARHQQTLGQGDWALLDRDLRELDRCQLNPQTPLPQRSIIIHGSADRIVPPSQGLALVEWLAQQPASAPTWIELENASHCFPFCETDRAWSLVQPLLC